MGLTTDVLIVGGGVIGTALAVELAGRGVSVTVVESGMIGHGASWAAAGVLAPEWGGDDATALTALADASLELWPEWVATIEERTGVGLNFRRDGLLTLWLDPDAVLLPHDLSTAPPSCPPGRGERLSAAEVRRLEPGLSGPVIGGMLHPGDAQVDNPRLAPTLARLANELGARLLTETTVTGLLGVAGRCTGITTADGRTLNAGAVVLAAGAWSGLLARASGITLGVTPYRGQMLAFEAPARPLRHMVFCGEMVLVPRPHGPLVVGTTLENVGFDARVTLAGLSRILARVERVAPGLGDLPMLRAWAGLRPGTADGLPYLGPVPGWEGLFAATGHGRKGIILAPLTARLLTRAILHDDVDALLLPCLPSR